jgi:hypothetical protein
MVDIMFQFEVGGSGASTHIPQGDLETSIVIRLSTSCQTAKIRLLILPV